MTTRTGDPNLHLLVWPAGPFGRWSVASAGALLLGQLVLWLATLAGQDRTSDEGFFDNWWLATPALLMVAGGVSALVCGVVAMIREHDRSNGVILSTVLGMLVALFLAFGE
jgi:ABC-type uncharacterized transport system permease subunit